MKEAGKYGHWVFSEENHVPDTSQIIESLRVEVKRQGALLDKIAQIVDIKGEVDKWKVVKNTSTKPASQAGPGPSSDKKRKAAPEPGAVAGPSKNKKQKQDKKGKGKEIAEDEAWSDPYYTISTRHPPHLIDMFIDCSSWLGDW